MRMSRSMEIGESGRNGKDAGCKLWMLANTALVISAYWAFHMNSAALSSPLSSGVNTILNPILQMKELRHREAKEFTPSPAALHC